MDNKTFKIKRIHFILRNNVNEVVFIPYAKVNGDYDGYTKMMADAIKNLGKIHQIIQKFVYLHDYHNISKEC